MASESQFHLVAGDAAAIVNDAHQTDASLAYFNFYLCGSGINGVLDQFLDHRGWSFHHFASGDFGRHLGRQHFNRHSVPLNLPRFNVLFYHRKSAPANYHCCYTELT